MSYNAYMFHFLVKHLEFTKESAQSSKELSLVEVAVQVAASEVFDGIIYVDSIKSERIDHLV